MDVRILATNCFLFVTKVGNFSKGISSEMEELWSQSHWRKYKAPRGPRRTKKFCHLQWNYFRHSNQVILCFQFSRAIAERFKKRLKNWLQKYEIIILNYRTNFNRIAIQLRFNVSGVGKGGGFIIFWGAQSKNVIFPINTCKLKIQTP